MSPRRGRVWRDAAGHLAGYWRALTRHLGAARHSSLVAILLITVLGMCPALAQASPALSWSKPVTIDHQAPFGESWRLQGVSCSSRSLCVAVDRIGQVLTSTDPGAGAAATWSAKAIDVPHELTGVSCALSSLCVAVDAADDVLTSRDPARGAKAGWRAAHVAGGPEEGLDGVSCPSPNLCVAVGAGGHGDLLTSNQPGRGRSSAWSVRRFRRNTSLTSVSCPSVALCVASGDEGDVLVSTDPRRGRAATWSFDHIDGSQLERVSCPSTSLCVAVDEAGNHLTSSDPGRGAHSTWTANRTLSALYAFPEQPTDLACASASLCLTTGLDGSLATSIDPALGASANWTVARPPRGGGYLTGASCVQSLCVVLTSYGRILSSSDAGEASSWAIEDVDGYTPIDSVSCTAVLCAAVDDSGSVFISRDPRAGARSWSRSNIDGDTGIGAVSCVASLCVAVDTRGNALISMDAALGARASWTTHQIDERHGLEGVSCASVHLCVAIDDQDAFATVNPSDGANAGWAAKTVDISSLSLSGIICPSVRLCVASDAEGSVFTSKDAGDGASAHWVGRLVDGKPGGSTGTLTGVSCVLPEACVTTDANTGHAFISTDAAQGALTSWHSSRLPFRLPGEGELAGVSCASLKLCLAFDGLGNVAVTRDLARAGRVRWALQRVDPPRLSAAVHVSGLSDLSCPTVRLCVGVDFEGRVVVGSS
jgi:hypothetical protein